MAGKRSLLVSRKPCWLAPEDLGLVRWWLAGFGKGGAAFIGRVENFLLKNRERFMMWLWGWLQEPQENDTQLHDHSVLCFSK